MLTPTHSFRLPNELIDKARVALELDKGVDKTIVIRLALVAVIELQKIAAEQ